MLRITMKGDRSNYTNHDISEAVIRAYIGKMLEKDVITQVTAETFLSVQSALSTRAVDNFRRAIYGIDINGCTLMVHKNLEDDDINVNLTFTEDGGMSIDLRYLGYIDDELDTLIEGFQLKPLINHFAKEALQFAAPPVDNASVNTDVEFQFAYEWVAGRLIAKKDITVDWLKALSLFLRYGGIWMREQNGETVRHCINNCEASLAVAEHYSKTKGKTGRLLAAVQLSQTVPLPRKIPHLDETLKRYVHDHIVRALPKEYQQVISTTLDFN